MQPRTRHGRFAESSYCFLITVLLVTALLVERSASQQCPGSCILPQPMPPSFQHGETDLDEAIFSLRCELSCIEQYAPDTELINDNSPWPTYSFDFSDNCGVHNKIQGCKQGCMEHFSHPETTVNRCRDSCYTECMDSEAEGSTGGVCPIHCRKTYCRFGCLLYESIISDNASSLPLPLSTSPDVAAIPSSSSCSRWEHKIAVSLPAQNETTSTPYPPQPVGFLLKLTTQDGSFVRYIWQKTLNLSLDLSPLACQQISLSHAVVSEFTSLSSIVFSSETTVCVPGLDAYPSQVEQTGIHVDFSEDFRESFFGYSVANLSWQRPQDYDCVTSYQVNIYPDRLECGGIEGREQPGVKFININKTLTSFIFRAREANGFMKFGCSYIFEIETLPVPGVQIGPRITRSTELTTVPSMDVQCERVWDKSGRFNVSVAITLQGLASTTHINQFTISPSITRNGSPINTPTQEALIPQGSTLEFMKVLGSQFVPSDDSQTMTIEVEVEKNQEYYWRKIPHEKQCTVSLDPIPPEAVKDILVENVHFTSSSKRLIFDLNWRSSVAYGQLSEYDMVVLSQEDRDLLLSGSSVEPQSPYFRKSITPNLTDMKFNASLNISSGVHCLYLKMRAKNNYTLFSPWSSAVVLPLDDECLGKPRYPDGSENTTSIPDQPGSTISVYYVADDGSRVNLLDVGCDADSGGSEESIQNRLQGIESRVDAVLSQLNGEQEAFERLSHLQAKLTDIEHKLDALMSLVTTHVYN